jgi:hypothetical protein
MEKGHWKGQNFIKGCSAEAEYNDATLWCLSNNCALKSSPSRHQRYWYKKVNFNSSCKNVFGKIHVRNSKYQQSL